MYSLRLHQIIQRRVAMADPSPFVKGITSIAKDWKRSIRARGGYWLGNFQLHADDVGRDELIWWFNNYLTAHIEEYTGGIKTWAGLIYEMTLTLDGAKYRRTCDREWWHNRVKVLYRSDGMGCDTGWGDDTDSQSEFGIMEYIDVISEATVSEADARRYTRLKIFAYPGSRGVGGLQFGSDNKRVEDNLDVIVAGYVLTMNQQFQETTIDGVAASTAISTLIGNAQYVGIGRIDTNTLSVDVECDTPQPIWDTIEDIILRGNASGDHMVGGVYNDRLFDYNAAATTIDYYMRDGVLEDRLGVVAEPTAIRPNFIVHNANAPSGGWPAQGVWDDPRNRWIVEVEFVSPDILLLKSAGFEDVDVLAIRYGYERPR